MTHPAAPERASRATATNEADDHAAPGHGVPTDREAVERLNAAEIEHDLFSFRTGRWCIWPIFKTDLQIRMTALLLPSRTSAPSLRWRLATAVRDAGALAVARPADIVIKTGTGTIEDALAGYHKDYLFDDLASSLPSFHKIEAVTVDHLSRTTKPLVPPLTTTGIGELAAGVGSRLSPTRDEAKLGTDLSRILRSLDFDYCTPQWVARRVAYFNWTRRAYKAILPRLCRKLLITGDPGDHAAVAAARELGLETIEFQHGFLDAFHRCYAWSSARPADYDGIPMAERLFLFGDHWSDALASIPFWDGRRHIVGSLRFDAYRARRAGRVRTGNRTVVFTTQGIDVPETIGLVRSALDQARSQRDLRFIFKLHPAWDTDKAPYLSAFAGDDRVSVLLGSDQPSTLDLLAAADLHVSISSTCHYEACSLGVPTAVLPFSTHEIMDPMVAAGHAVAVRSSHDLSELFSRAAEIATPPEAAAYYFQPHAEENMRRAIFDILDGRG